MVANARQLPQAITALVEPSAPMWAQRMLLKFQGHFQPISPRQPNKLWPVEFADLPPADAWPSSVVITEAGPMYSDGVAWAPLGSAAPFRGALVARATTLVGFNATPPAYIPFDSEVYDTAGIFDPAQPTRLTVPAGASRVRLTSNLLFTSVTNGEVVAVTLDKNGSTAGFPGTFALRDVGVGNAIWLTGETSVVNVVPGDFFALRCWPNADNAIDLLAPWCSFGLEVVG